MTLENLKFDEPRKLQMKLMIEENLPVAYAAILTDNALHRFDKRVLEGVRAWLDGKLTDDFSVEEISIADIKEELGLTGFSALSFLDVYLKDPVFAEKNVIWFERRYD